MSRKPKRRFDCTFFGGPRDGAVIAFPTVNETIDFPTTPDGFFYGNPPDVPPRQRSHRYRLDRLHRVSKLPEDPFRYVYEGVEGEG